MPAAVKRKEPTEGTRRSDRGAATGDAADVETKGAAKAGKDDAAPAKKAKVAPKYAEDSDDDEEDEDEEEVEEKKGAKKGGVGSVVSDVVLKDENDEDISLAALYAESGLVIFSYPKANTPGCTNQACGFRDLHDEITAAGFKVLGLSQDKPKAQLNWKTKKELQYTLLSDPSRKLLKALGATEAKKRCHWVIEKGGKLLEAAIGVSPATDPKNALAFVKAL